MVDFRLRSTSFVSTSKMDFCPNCEFNAIRRFTPSVDVTKIERTTIDNVTRTSILNDIADIKRELRDIDALILKIRGQHNKVVKAPGGSKALLSPIRRLPRGTLLQIFDLASSHNPYPFNAPWVPGHVCSTWRSITRSFAWTKFHLAGSCSDHFTFFGEYNFLSHHPPVPLSLEERPGKEMRGLFHDTIIHSGRCSSMELNICAGQISELLFYALFPAVNSTKLHINLVVETFVPDTGLGLVKANGVNAASLRRAAATK
ncbi:uncharacterized protein EV420DRAFT_1477712 [Desarmillaria tabescens]|uniref:F-box domain-containing protein n=1 Tax=Armillaria tabescens TaxID=1929756 RepID=A0AA39NAF8_ARMTA|nr:uncharacterized protein EV420DRAFT_1477712 [Desarmillaria tabescens]KAK0462022.1 hypothetical protein EV420DRAFT_1477712 [Desarmillaria tabescens]